MHRGSARDISDRADCSAIMKLLNGELINSSRADTFVRLRFKARRVGNSNVYLRARLVGFLSLLNFACCLFIVPKRVQLRSCCINGRYCCKHIDFVDFAEM